MTKDLRKAKLSTKDEALDQLDDAELGDFRRRPSSSRDRKAKPAKASAAAWGGATRNCQLALLVPNENPISSSSQRDLTSRRVSVSKWYDIMARIGLFYGPQFRGITALSSSTSEDFVAGEIKKFDCSSRWGRFYSIRLAIDACLQLSLVAITRGSGPEHHAALCFPQ